MTQHLEVDMLLCDAYGYCAELLPELVERDEWGYPIVAGDVPPERLADARRAAAACPKLALRLSQRTRIEPSRALKVDAVR